jgi:allantoin racemase
MEGIMATRAPLKIMDLNPVASSGGDDPLFAEMARDHKLPQTEVHVASRPESVGGFTDIEFRAYEAMAMRGIIRAVRAAAREAFGAWIVVPAEAESPARRAA